MNAHDTLVFDKGIAVTAVRSGDDVIITYLLGFLYSNDDTSIIPSLTFSLT